MIKEVIVTGKTIEEARGLAIKKLGVAEHDISIQIIDMPAKKVLGVFGGKPAKVRAYYDDGVTKPDNKKPKVQQKSSDLPKTKPAAITESPKKPANKSFTAEGEAREINRQKQPYVEEEGVIKNPADADIAPTITYLRTILDALKFTNYTLSLKEASTIIKIQVDGEDSACVIGHRGETLDSIQYLCNLTNNSHKNNDIKRIVININDYRDRREIALRNLASRIAKQVAKTGRNQSLEPMSPHERRVIHSMVQEIEGVNSWSIGEGNSRRVVIGINKGTRSNSNDNKPVSVQPRRNPLDTVQPTAVTEAAVLSESPASPKPPAKSVHGDTPLYGKVK